MATKLSDLSVGCPQKRLRWWGSHNRWREGGAMLWWRGRWKRGWGGSTSREKRISISLDTPMITSGTTPASAAPSAAAAAVGAQRDTINGIHWYASAACHS